QNTHRYDRCGNYKIIMSGDILHFVVQNHHGTRPCHVVHVNYINIPSIKSLAWSFCGEQNLKSIDYINLQNCRDLFSMFRLCRSLSRINTLVLPNEIDCMCCMFTETQISNKCNIEIAEKLNIFARNRNNMCPLHVKAYDIFPSE